MKKINKKEPSFYTEFKKKRKPKNWADCIEITADLRNYILSKEQNGQCAYCETAITSDSSRSHIDHYKKKAGHLFPELEFAYDNLLASCNNPYHCAKHKDSRITQRNDYVDLINPVADNPSVHFDYSFTGDILPKDKKGETSINIFNLNHRSLIERRKTLSLQLNSYKNQINLDEVKSFFKGYDSFIENIWNS